jgi:hypothetical protein
MVSEVGTTVGEEETKIKEEETPSTREISEDYFQTTTEPPTMHPMDIDSQ